MILIVALASALTLRAQLIPGSAFDNYTPPPNADFLAEIRNNAERSDRQSQYTLGVIMFYGQLGVTTNKTEAAKWLRKASERGHPWAQNHLGVMYETGNGVEKNLSEAARLYRQSAEQGLAYAQNNLGVLLQFGKGLPQNETEAVAWYRKAAEQEYPDAQSNLAYMYANGKGVETNFVEAMTWWSLAAAQSNEPARIGIKMLQPEMTKEQLRQAKQKVKAFHPADATKQQNPIH